MGNFTIQDLVVGDISEKSKYSEGRQLFLGPRLKGPSVETMAVHGAQ